MAVKDSDQIKFNKCNSCCNQIKSKKEIDNCESWCKEHHSNKKEDIFFKII